MTEDRGVKAPALAPDEGWGIDRWTGDREKVQGMWPGDQIDTDEHEHNAACGAYYTHSHPEPQDHSHTHKKCEWCI